ncbi:hypothetical protein AN963_20480 [Brevibacillus choshinensis]|uniref:Uncharacterized protein n=1 Tax=Brevibacillus choshinensis TaxID=54911 RepID=A0ABR5N070_BRECH|nr:hypothetical protein [Brevibacillus choshinensis]KQL43851.1 hypothetical protein AN963_20480 [Brevibacillus choshinensis]
MLQFMVEQLNEQLSLHGTIVDVILRSDQSLVEEEEIREVILTFTEAEDEGKPVATIHLFELAEENSCEVEVEVEYPGAQSAELTSHLWEQAKRLVPEISLTEKRRFLEPKKPAQETRTLDFHFVVEQPLTEEELQQFTSTLERFSADLGKLVRMA